VKIALFPFREMPSAAAQGKARSSLHNSRPLVRLQLVFRTVYNLYLPSIDSFSIASPMNALSAPPSSHTVQLQPNQLPLPPWEFTRRKRWADLLITELSEAIVLVLSPRRKVLFCNPAVREILGWQDGELIDKDFKDFVNGLYPSRPHRPRPAHVRARATQ